MRKTIKIKIIVTAIAALLTFISAGCENTGTSQNSSNVSDAISFEMTETESQPAESTEPIVDSESSDPKKEHVFVENGKFSLPGNAFSFTLADGWEMTDNGIAYQFENEESENNTFNLVVAETYTDVAEITESQMTGTYQSMMEDFSLIDFQHTEIGGMPAVYMQISGKYSMMTTETVIYQYAIQAGDMLYTLSFTQGGWDDGFSDMIAELINSVEVNEV